MDKMKLLYQLFIFAVIAQCIFCCPYNWEKVSNRVCRMPSFYGRGVGYPWKFGDGLNLNAARRRCENDNKTLGCEQWGAVIYPKCKEGFTFSGCCICVPYCPKGYTYEEPIYCKY